ncbi:glycosyltransferase [Azohydromonas lata]|uniref:Glycosyltransferase n=1 Tax=Azohydromonas lata TaxID=45677 RepID=A0ABU5IN27_9BURK|nr:glycosyltransferase [Azohydromonas lata]MDZ5460323.1 glycosyltransferase [Azohydromonas lata]
MRKNAASGIKNNTTQTSKIRIPCDALQGIDALEIIRLLRKDILQNLRVPENVSEEQRIAIWWIISGRKEYPSLSLDLPPALCRTLFMPLPGWEHRGGLGMNLVLLCLYLHRPNLQAAFDLGDPLGYWDAISWFYLHAVEEFDLSSFVDSETRAALNSSAFPAEQYSSPSWLMVLLWRSSEPVRKVFDIEANQGRASFLQWFKRQGMDQFKLRGLVEPQAKQSQIRNKGAVMAQRCPAAPYGVNLIGFAFGELGIGEDLRMAAQACKSADIPFKVFNVNPGPQLRQADQLLAPHVVQDAKDLPYTINLFCLTGFDTLRVFAELGPALFAGRYNIGWWPWELPVWPKRWTPAFTVVDEIWAASRFTQTMYSAATDKPVTLVRLPACVNRIKPVSRRSLGLPAKRFLFLYIFDFNSYLERKNPWAVLDAFQRAFPDDDSVGLVMKTMNTRPGDERWKEFVRRCLQDNRIVLLEKTLDRTKVLGLIKACDAYISLHRSEGFGRTLAEAMLLGKPVVGTGFSGNADFLTRHTGYPVKWNKRLLQEGEYPFIQMEDSAWWADADIGHAARQMQAARDAAGSEWALQLPQQVRDVFSPTVIGERMNKLLKHRFKAFLGASAKKPEAVQVTN